MKTAQELHTEGKNFLNERKFEDAHKCLEEAINLDPTLMDAYNDKYKMYFSEGKFDEVQNWCDKALEVNSTDKFSLFSKARAFNAQKKYDDALEWADKTIALYPDWATVYNTKGNTLRYQNKPKEALEIFLKCVELNPTYLYPLRNISLIYSDEANYEEALKWIDKCIEQAPGDAHYLIDKGNYLKKLGRKAEALEVLKLANKLYAEGSFNIDLIPSQMEWVKTTIVSLDELEKAHAQAEASIQGADQSNPAVKNAVDHLATLQSEIEKVSHDIVDQMGNNDANSEKELSDKLQGLKEKVLSIPELLKTAQEWHAEGKKFKNNRKFADAHRCFDEAIKLDPSLMAAYHDKYEIYFSEGKFEEVHNLADKALEINPTDDMSNFSKARGYNAQKKYDDALIWADKTIELYPNWATIYNTKANTLRYQKKPKEALEIFLKCVELNPNYIYPLRNIALIYSDEANYEEALKWIDKCIEKSPGDAHYLIDKGNYLKKLGRKAEALEVLKLANKLYAEGSFNIDLIPSQLEWVKATIKSLDELEKAHAQADAIVQGADQSNPAIKNLVDHLATLQSEIEKVSHNIVDQMGSNNANSDKELFDNLQDLKERMRSVQEQLGIMHTKTAEEWNAEGKKFKNNRKFADAHRCFDEAIKLDPSLMAAYHDKYEIYFSEGKFEEVHNLADKALEIKPTDDLANFSKARAFNAQKKYDDALIWADKTIELYPNWATIYNTKGNTLRYQNKLDESLQVFLKCVELNPKYLYPLRNISLIYSDNGNYEEALKYIEKCIEQAPGDAHYLIDKGEYLKKLGRKEEALEAFKKATKLYAQGSFNIDLVPTQIQRVKNILDSLDDMEKAQLEAEASIQTADQSNPAVKNAVDQLVSLQKEIEEVSNILVEQVGSNDAIFNQSLLNDTQILKEKLAAVQQQLIEAQAAAKIQNQDQASQEGSSSA